jgi:hypothetical protein
LSANRVGGLKRSCVSFPSGVLGLRRYRWGGGVIRPRLDAANAKTFPNSNLLAVAATRQTRPDRPFFFDAAVVIGRGGSKIGSLSMACAGNGRILEIDQNSTLVMDMELYTHTNSRLYCTAIGTGKRNTMNCLRHGLESPRRALCVIVGKISWTVSRSHCIVGVHCSHL